MNIDRVTQIGLLRLLTSESVMGSEMLTPKAWHAHDEFLEDDRVEFAHDRRILTPSFVAIRRDSIPLLGLGRMTILRHLQLPDG